ncbi:hypothetical protein G4B88_003176 [Cannabis sativa]|uniref:Uncharacterized protein n=1 Tax=Cannabis sativa TaxID=3483 RepID=A0A7J6DTB4_CANSA|nr:hypothetical protein G4B88_003176 [Cannabis sativa]
MGRAPCCEKMGLKKGPWTPEEDQILINYVQKFGHANWRALPKQAGLLRCGKSCRLRWINYLRPDIKRGNFTAEEEQTIINLHQMLGNRWSAIAARLPGRTDNEIKNVWHTHLKKRLLNNNNINSNNLSSSSSKRQRIDDNDQHQSTTTSCSSSSDSDFSSVTAELLHQNDNKEIVVIKDEEEEEEDNSNNQVSSSSAGSCTNIIIDDESMIWPLDQVVSSFDGHDHHDDESLLFVNNGNDEYDMEFWYDIFIKAGGSTELPEF